MESLITDLQNRNWNVRRFAIDALGSDASMVEQLIVIMRDRNAYAAYVRSNAALALGTLKDVRAAKPLTDSLQDEIPYIRQCAAEALEAIGWDPQNDKSNYAWYLIAKQQWEMCVKLGLPAVEPLIATLQDISPFIRRYVVETLGAIEDGRAVSPLIQTALHDKDTSVRRRAVEALGAIKDARAVKPLIAILQDENSDLRQQSTKVLGVIGDMWAFEPLIAALQDKSYLVRRQAAEALGNIKDTQAVGPLITTLQDENSDVRQQVAEALEAIGWKAEQDISNQVWYLIASQQWNACVKLGTFALEPLVAALRDKDWRVRRDASKALGDFEDERAVKPLLSVLIRDNHWDTREAASEALGCFLPYISTKLRGQIENELKRFRREYDVHLQEIQDKDAC